MHSIWHNTNRKLIDGFSFTIMDMYPAVLPFEYLRFVRFWSGTRTMVVYYVDNQIMGSGAFVALCFINERRNIMDNVGSRICASIINYALIKCGLLLINRLIDVWKRVFLFLNFRFEIGVSGIFVFWWSYVRLRWNRIELCFNFNLIIWKLIINLE